MLKVGERKTTVGFGEIPAGTFRSMWKQLRIDRKSF